MQTPQATKFSTDQPFKIHTGAAIVPQRQINLVFYNCCKLIKANPLDKAEVCYRYSAGSTDTLTRAQTARLVWVEILELETFNGHVLNIRGSREGCTKRSGSSEGVSL